MTTCNGPGPDGTLCHRPRKSKGLCDTHRKQQARGHELTVIQEIRTGCIVEGCAREHRARGYCHAHYQSIVKGGKPSLTFKPCVGPGPDGTLCGREATGRGYCPAHARQDRLGQELKPLRMVGQAVVKARGGEIRNGSNGPRKPRPSRAKKSSLPPGWFTPSKPTRSNPTSAPLDEDRIDVLLRPQPLTPETMQAARSKLIAWGASDLLEMLGLDAA